MDLDRRFGYKLNFLSALRKRRLTNVIFTHIFNNIETVMPKIGALFVLPELFVQTKTIARIGLYNHICLSVRNIKHYFFLLVSLPIECRTIKRSIRVVT